MKLRHPLLIRAVSLPASLLLRLYLGTLTYRVIYDDPACDPRKAPCPGLYLFWHEMMLLPAYSHASAGIAVLVSHHADGELISQIMRMLGGRTVRGSTSKGGATALREMMRRGKLSHLAITPDGPRGPRRVMHSGAVYLASRTGMPLIPVGLAYRACWRNRSWDRMAFPHPWGWAQAVVGAPIQVPPDANREAIETYRVTAQSAMDEVQRRAERAVEPPVSPA